jgi:hypothetical protein
MKAKKIHVGLFRIVIFKENYLEAIEENLTDWQSQYQTTPVRVNADTYYASCITFQKKEKILDVRLSKEISTEVHKRKRGEEPTPIQVGDDEDLEGITYLRFYFGKQLCFFISNKEVSPHAPARFINWNENLIDTSDESFLEGFRVEPYLKKSTKEDLESLISISSLDLKFDIQNTREYENEFAKAVGLSSMKSFNGKFLIDKGVHPDMVREDIWQIFSQKPNKLIVHGKAKNNTPKVVNLTEDRYKESEEIQGNLTKDIAFDILDKKFKEFNDV